MRHAWKSPRAQALGRCLGGHFTPRSWCHGFAVDIACSDKICPLRRIVVVEIVNAELTCVVLFAGSVSAQTTTPQTSPAVSPSATDGRGEFYVGWGYNTNRYARTDIHFTQPTLGSDFTLHDVRFHDSPGLRDLFTSALTVPQYNFQFGYYLRNNLAVELKFVHAKAIVTQGQTVQATGTLGGAQIDSPLVLDTETLRYQLNNGANFVLVNVVRQIPVLRAPRDTGSVALLLKAGGGFTIPHSENTVFGQDNDRGFGVSGPALAAEVAVRVRAYKWLYGEVSQVGVWARYRDLQVFEGHAGQNLRASTTTFVVGVSMPVGGP